MEHHNHNIQSQHDYSCGMDMTPMYFHTDNEAIFLIHE